MKHRKLLLLEMIVLAILIIVIIVVTSHAKAEANAQQTGIANPASVFCEDSNGTLEIRTDASGGQYGVCKFQDGTECEEWKYFRGECS